MLRLKSRQKFIPQGFQFYLPQVKWQAPRMRSFDTVTQGLWQVVQANPVLAAKHKWPTTLAGAADWVDLYNATVCARMGWDDYIVTDQGPSVPKPSAPHQRETLASLKAAAAAAKQLVSGAKTVAEFLDSGEPPVPAGLSVHRALICSVCPQNSPDDLTKWFTIPAAELIKRQIQKAQGRKLSTPSDDRLHLCLACHCPLKVKVHYPIDWVTKRLEAEQIERLKQGKDCWILAEAGLA